MTRSFFDSRQVVYELIGRDLETTLHAAEVNLCQHHTQDLSFVNQPLPRSTHVHAPQVLYAVSSPSSSFSQAMPPLLCRCSYLYFPSTT